MEVTMGVSSLSFLDFLDGVRAFTTKEKWKAEEVDKMFADIAAKGGDYSFIEDGGQDSLDAVEFVMFFEEHWGFEIKDEILGQPTNIGELYVRTCKAAGVSPDASMQKYK